jgi:ribosome-associated translation inhibitor RaiA
MQIQVNTDNQIDGHERMQQFVETTIEESLRRFADTLTRVEVHFHDENSNKKGGGNDIRCVVEARPRGLKPITVSNNSASLDQALSGAVDKVTRALEHALGKLGAR